MPELPEVETVARELARAVVGQRLRRVELLDPRLGDPPVDELAGRTIDAVERVGKQVVFRCARRRSAEALYLVVHLRMTGRLIVQPPGQRQLRAHLRARLLLRGGGAVCFHDPRRFGTLAVVHGRRQLRPAGVDPMSRAFTARRLAALLRGSRQPIKSWLLRQDRLVGLGNIYASEILFRAGIHPDRSAGSLRRPQVVRLHRAARAVLRAAIAACGTTFSDFQTTSGSIGGYQQQLAVYGREGAPCPRCAGRVERLVQQQRSTFFCPRCQRPSSSRRR